MFRYCGLGEQDLDRAVAWQQPWTEEAVMHYLNMQGYQVPLQMEDCLLEEDALAIAAQDAAVKYGGQLSKEALARNPPVVPGAHSPRKHAPANAHEMLWLRLCACRTFGGGGSHACVMGCVVSICVCAPVHMQRNTTPVVSSNWMH